jgi:hypothetical protein
MLMLLEDTADAYTGQGADGAEGAGGGSKGLV